MVDTTSDETLSAKVFIRFAVTDLHVTVLKLVGPAHVRREEVFRLVILPLLTKLLLVIVDVAKVDGIEYPPCGAPPLIDETLRDEIDPRDVSKDALLTILIVDAVSVLLNNAVCVASRVPRTVRLPVVVGPRVALFGEFMLPIVAKGDVILL